MKFPGDGGSKEEVEEDREEKADDEGEPELPGKLPLVNLSVPPQGNPSTRGQPRHKHHQAEVSLSPQPRD